MNPVLTQHRLRLAQQMRAMIDDAAHAGDLAALHVLFGLFDSLGSKWMTEDCNQSKSAMT